MFNRYCKWICLYALFSWYKILEVFVIANKEKDLFINEQIRAKEVMVIGPNGEQLGIKSIKDAITLSTYAGFDLVMINPNGNPPVCKVMDYNKFKYEKKKKSKEAQKKQRETMVETKEFRLSVNIDIHDFDTRVNNARKAFEKGNKVKASIRFKGRQIAHPELAQDVLDRFYEKVSDIADIETKPKIEGRTMYMMLTPKK